MPPGIWGAFYCTLASLVVSSWVCDSLNTVVDDLIKAGRYDEAKAKLLAGESGNADALGVLLELRELLRQKEYDQARKLLARDGDLMADFLESNQVKAALEAFESNDEAKVQPFLESPHLAAEALCALGLVQVRSGQTEAAKGSFESALKQDPGHYRAKTNLGNMLLEAGNTDAAIALYTEALEQNPDFPLAHHNLGAAYRKKGQLDKSVFHVKRGQRLQGQMASRSSSVRSQADIPLPRSPLGNLSGRWWVWLIAAAFIYWLFRR